MEKKRLRLILRSVDGSRVKQRIIVTSLDYSDFCTSSSVHEIKMQELMIFYVSMGEAIGGELNGK